LFQCKKSVSIHNVLSQLSYGFCTQVTSYGCYDVNGYRFRSEKYERGRPGLTTINTCVCVTSYDENNNALEYCGVIEDIIKIEWEGCLKLELVLFYCRWFDPTPNGVRCTEDLGLVEIKHALRLKSFDPFVMASQVTQVYYLSYPCKDRDLSPWWVVYQVAPHGCVPLNGANDESMSSEHIIHDVYQEDGLDGTFVVDLGEALDSLVSLGSDEITDVVDLEAIERAMVEDEEYDEEGHTTEEEDEAITDESDEETYDQDDY
jgi:hypothetical protein